MCVLYVRVFAELCVCLRVGCVCVSVWVCLHGCVRALGPVARHTCLEKHQNIFVCAFMLNYILNKIYMKVSWAYTQTSVYIHRKYIRIHKYIFIKKYMLAHICKYIIYVNINVKRFPYIYIYIEISMPIYMYIDKLYKYIQIQMHT